MSKDTTANNKIQKYVLSQLSTKEFARFKDLQPPRTSSNIFSYHLKQLVNGGWIQKNEQGYTLGIKGLAFAERGNEETTIVRMQPNIAIVLLIQDSNGKVLLQKRSTQPYLHHWQLPTVRALVVDVSVMDAGIWAAKQTVHYVPETVRHAGDCYIRLHSGKIAVSSTLFHVVRFEVDTLSVVEDTAWYKPLDIGKIATLPGTEQIMTRAFFNDEFFFEEYTVQLTTQERFGI